MRELNHSVSERINVLEQQQSSSMMTIGAQRIALEKLKEDNDNLHNKTVQLTSELSESRAQVELLKQDLGATANRVTQDAKLHS